MSRIVQLLIKAAGGPNSCAACIDHDTKLKLALAVLERRRAVRAHRALVQNIVHADAIQEISAEIPPLGLPSPRAG